MKGRIILAIVTLLAVFAMAFTPSIAAATSCSGLTVDIGNPVSETQVGVAIAGWGPIEPLTSGGVWGGIQGDCRVAWEPQGNPTASITYTYASCVFPTCLEWKVLDGTANDSYLVYVDGTLVYTYIDQTPVNDAEIWSVVCQPLTGLRNDVQHTVEFIATGEAWGSWGTYGQLAIDYVTLGTAPCTGNGKVGVEVIVGNPECICIDVTPTSLDFGLLYPGQGKTILDALTIENCGNVNVKVTATTGGFYTANLLLDATSLAAWMDTISASASDKVDATLNIPGGQTVGPQTDQLVFWAVKN